MLGLVSAVPSANRRVGTVRFPPLACMTSSAAAESFSMSTSAKTMPSRCISFLSSRQEPHHWAVNIVTAALVVVIGGNLHGRAGQVRSGTGGLGKRGTGPGFDPAACPVQPRLPGDASPVHRRGL